MKFFNVCDSFFLHSSEDMLWKNSTFASLDWKKLGHDWNGNFVGFKIDIDMFCTFQMIYLSNESLEAQAGQLEVVTNVTGNFTR